MVYLSLRFSEGYFFKARYTDHVARQKRHKRIGDLGEQIVLQHERECCSSNFVDKIEDSSKIQGAGLEFDIYSFDERGDPKYIEVKATTVIVKDPCLSPGLSWHAASKKVVITFYIGCTTLMKKYDSRLFHHPRRSKKLLHKSC